MKQTNESGQEFGVGNVLKLFDDNGKSHDDEISTCTIAPTILRVSWKMRSFDQTLFMFCIRAAMLLWSRRKEVWRAARPTKSVARLSPAVISFLPLFGGKTRPLITWIETMRFVCYAARCFMDHRWYVI